MYGCKRKISIKKIIAALCLALTVFLISDSKEVSQNTYQGIIFSARYVISAVFPFIFLSRLLIDTSYLEIAADKLAPLMLKMKKNPYTLPPFLLSLFCGFPVGAVYINELCNKNLITKKEADRLLPMCNNPSPAFVISTVGAGFLHSQAAGLVLWLANTFFSCVITMLFLPEYKSKKEYFNLKIQDYSFSVSFVEAVRQSVRTALSIGGTVTLFYLISKILADTLQKHGISKGLTALCVSMLEIGNGCMYGSTLQDYSSVLSAFAVGFGGLCVMFQVKAAAHKNSSMSFYLLSKGLCGLLCAFFAFFLL